MTSYEWMIKANHDLIKYGALPEGPEAAVGQFLSDRRTGASPGGKKTGPVFFLPPEGVRLKTVLGQTPKTKLFAGNMYELEILRLLCVLAPDHEEVRHMAAATLDRLRETCFGYEDDGLGECFDASLVVLRFLAAAAP